MASSPAYSRGFSDGRREAARTVLDTLADGASTASARLAAFPDAQAAVNEATAILRDAARALEFDPAATRGQAERPATASAAGPSAGGSVAVERPADAAGPGLSDQKEPTRG